MNESQERSSSVTDNNSRVEEQHERKQEQCSSATDSNNKAVERARAGAAPASSGVEVAVEEATTWGRDVVMKWPTTAPSMETRHVYSVSSTGSPVRSNKR